MNKIQLLKMAFTNLFRRKARSILAILGVLIGTASIITMVSIGLGISKNFTDTMKKNESLHVIQIFGISKRNQTPGSQTMKMDDKAIKYLKNIKGVTFATPVKNLNTRVIVGDYVADMNITGIDPEFFDKAHIEFQSGHNLKTGDKFKFIFGSMTAFNFQNYKTGRYIDYSPDGKTPINFVVPKIELTNDPEYKKAKVTGRRYGITREQSENPPKYEVFRAGGVGVIRGEGEYSFSAYTTLETLNLIEKSNKRAENAVGQKNSRYESRNNDQYQSIMIYIEDINLISDITEKLREEGFEFYSIMDEIKEAQKTYAMIQGALGGIGAISLLVAAIGITNTMIMSIYERTREIGVMKVIGASLYDIKRLFLCEAASIGLIGGILGTVLSLIISYVLNFLYSKFGGGGIGMMDMYSYGYMGMGTEQSSVYISYIPPWLVMFGILFSTFIGIVSGYIPAKKAMSLSALESLRNE